MVPGASRVSRSKILFLFQANDDDRGGLCCYQKRPNKLLPPELRTGSPSANRNLRAKPTLITHEIKEMINLNTDSQRGNFHKM